MREVWAREGGLSLGGQYGTSPDLWALERWSGLHMEKYSPETRLDSMFEALPRSTSEPWMEVCVCVCVCVC